MFEPLQPREYAVDACAAQLRDAILGEELQPGARLPSERSLADTFGVNRVTVRSALSRLASENLLSVRQGSGYVVQDYLAGGGPDLIVGLARQAEEPAAFVSMVRDLLRVRRSLAAAVLERLAEGTPDTGPIDAAIDRFEVDVRAGASTEVLAQRDMEVLGAVIDATGSPVFRLCMNPVASVVAEFERLRRAIYAEPLTNVAGYRMLAAALRTGRPDVTEALVAELRRRDEHTLEQLESTARPGVWRVADPPVQ